MKELFSYIVLDMLEPISYLPIGICIGLLLYMLLSFLFKNNKKQLRLISIFLCYLVVVIIQTLLSRESGSRDGMDLALFSTWGDTIRSHAYVIENIIMLIPYGFLLSLLISNHFMLVGCSGLLFSCCLEITQLITQRGYFQIDDIIMNTIGCMIGILVVQCMKKVSHV